MDTSTRTADGAVAGMVIQSIDNLAPELQVAQRAIALPEVQEMLRRLADFNLGIYMPHLHEEGTGRFLPQPYDMIQVEQGLKVTFQTEEQLAQQSGPVVQVGWAWRKDAVVPSAGCVAKCIGGKEDIHSSTHKVSADDEEDGE